MHTLSIRCLVSFVCALAISSANAQIFTQSFQIGGVKNKQKLFASFLRDLHVQPDGSFLVAEEHRILFFDKNGKLQRTMDKIVDKRNVVRCEISGIAHDPRGFIYVVNWSRQNVLKIDRSGKVLRTFGGAENRALGHFKQPSAIALDPKGNLYVADNSAINRSLCIQKFDPSGRLVKQFGQARTNDYPPHREPNILNKVDDLAVDTKGNLYYADDTRVQVFAPDGKLLRVIDGESSSEDDNTFDNICVGKKGRIYAHNDRNGTVQIYSATGKLLSQFGTRGVSPGSCAIGLDQSGNVVLARTNTWEMIVRKYRPRYLKP